MFIHKANVMHLFRSAVRRLVLWLFWFVFSNQSFDLFSPIFTPMEKCFGLIIKGLHFASVFRRDCSAPTFIASVEKQKLQHEGSSEKLYCVVMCSRKTM